MNNIIKNNEKNIELIEKVKKLYSIYSNIKKIMNYTEVKEVTIMRMVSPYEDEDKTYYEPFLLLENIPVDPLEKDQYWSMVGFPLEQSIQMIFDYYSKLIPEKVKIDTNESITKLFFGEEGVALVANYDGYKAGQNLSIYEHTTFKEFFEEISPDSMKKEIKYIQLNKKLGNNTKNKNVVLKNKI